MKKTFGIVLVMIMTFQGMAMFPLCRVQSKMLAQSEQFCCASNQSGQCQCGMKTDCSTKRNPDKGKNVPSQIYQLSKILNLAGAPVYLAIFKTISSPAESIFDWTVSFITNPSLVSTPLRV